MGGVDSKALFKEAIQDLANKEQVSIVTSLFLKVCKLSKCLRVQVEPDKSMIC